MRLDGRFASRRGIAWRARVLRRIARVSWRHGRAEARMRRGGRAPETQCTLLIVGCQRSGTTLMTQLLASDAKAKVYPEHSALSLGDLREHLRLAPLPQVRRRLERSRFPFVVMKPLVESQNTRRMLDGLPNARALWMMRHYLSVARSNLRRFGARNGIRNLRLAIEAVEAQGNPGWRGEGISEETQRWLRETFSEAMNPLDAAALFWVMRNQLFFDQELGRDERVRALAYEDLTAEPIGTVHALYAFTKREGPDREALRRAADGVRPARNEASAADADDLQLSEPVRERCESMWTRLQALDNRLQPCTSSS